MIFFNRDGFTMGVLGLALVWLTDTLLGPASTGSPLFAGWLTLVCIAGVLCDRLSSEEGLRAYYLFADGLFTSGRHAAAARSTSRVAVAGVPLVLWPATASVLGVVVPLIAGDELPPPWFFAVGVLTPIALFIRGMFPGELGKVEGPKGRLLLDWLNVVAGLLFLAFIAWGLWGLGPGPVLGLAALLGFAAILWFAVMLWFTREYEKEMPQKLEEARQLLETGKVIRAKRVLADAWVMPFMSAVKPPRAKALSAVLSVIEAYAEPLAIRGQGAELVRAARLLLDRAEAQQLTYELFSYEVDLLAAVDPMLRDPGKWAMNDHLCNLAAKLARSHGNTGSESSGLDAADR